MKKEELVKSLMGTTYPFNFRVEGNVNLRAYGQAFMLTYKRSHPFMGMHPEVLLPMLIIENHRFSELQSYRIDGNSNKTTITMVPPTFPDSHIEDILCSLYDTWASGEAFPSKIFLVSSPDEIESPKGVAMIGTICPPLYVSGRDLFEPIGYRYVEPLDGSTSKRAKELILLHKMRKK